MRENRLRWVRHVERKNIEDLIKKIGQIRGEENWGRGRPKKKWTGVINEEMRACRVGENMVRYKEEEGK